MKFKVKAKDCNLTVRVKLTGSEAMDTVALNSFERLFLRGFLKPKMIRSNEVEYTGPVGASLQERLKKPLSRRDFLFIFEQLAVDVQKMHANNMSLNRLILDTRYAFVNDVTKELQLLYVPTVGELDSTGLNTFVDAIIYSVIPADQKDAELVSRFTYFFRSQKYFNPEAVEAFIGREDMSVVNTIRKQNAGQSGFMTSDRSKHFDHYAQSGHTAGPKGMLADDERTGLLSGNDEATALLSEEAEETSLLVEDEEGTTLLDESQASVHYPELERLSTGERVSVNKPVFRLGKERSYVDYFVSNNSAVSRSHADIITRGTACFVTDLNSKNRTFINNQAILPQTETQIRDGDILKLANEEFILHM